MPASLNRPSIHDTKPIAVTKVGHWIGGVLLALFASSSCRSCVPTRTLQWSVVGQYVFNPAILSGLS